MQEGWRSSYFRYKDFFLNVLRVYRSRPDLKSFLEIILSITTIIIFSLFAIRPTIITIIELNKTIKTKEETLSKMQQKIKNLQTASSVLNQQSADLPYIYEAVPKTAEIEKVFGQIQGHALNSSAEILSISSSDILLIGKEEKVKNEDESALPQEVKELQITTTVTGGYQNLIYFLTNIENTRRPFKVDLFTFSAGKTDDSQFLIMTLTGRLPYEE